MHFMNIEYDSFHFYVRQETCLQFQCNMLHILFSFPALPSSLCIYYEGFEG